MEPSDGKMFQEMAAVQCTEFTHEEAVDTVLKAVMPHHYNGLGVLDLLPVVSLSQALTAVQEKTKNAAVQTKR